MFGMCKKHATDVYDMRKDINEIRAKLELPPSDIGEPPVFEDPFTAYDADVVAWYAAQESGEVVEEEAQEEEEIAPAQSRRRPRCPHGKDPLEEEEIQDEDDIEEEGELAYVSDANDDDDDGNTSDDDRGDGDYEDDE